ncbi:MAG: AtpZ/AtpI family protein, partial [Dehalococcoidia bacterium]|nr:AtpZ/AtpI family protein [Dehalococcoidia bacterium]
ATSAMRGDWWTAPLQLVGVGWFVALTIGLGVVGGQWLDSTLHTAPLLTLVGLFGGLTIALVGAYRMMIDATRRRSTPRKDRP